MKNYKVLLAVLAITLVFGMTVVGCNNGSTNDSQEPTAYKGIDLAGNEYTLTIQGSSSKAIRAGQSGNGFKVGESYTLKTKTKDGKNGTSSGTITEILNNKLTLTPSNGSEFDVVINDDVISSIVGNVTLSDGTVFIVRTFDKIYMTVGRWRNGGYHNEDGDNYAAGDIKLKDIYEGDLSGIVSNEHEKVLTLRLSGTIDTKLSNVRIRLYYTSYNDTKWADDGSNSQWLGGGQMIDDQPYDFVEIGPGEFSKDFKIQTIKKDINTFPEGEVNLYLEHLVYVRDPEFPVLDLGDKPIPDNIPNGTIMATIRNLKVTTINMETVD